MPPFVKSDEKEAIQFFEKQLRNALTVSVEALQKRIESECEAIYNSQKQEAAESYQTEIDKLWAEISNLKEENAKLKKETKFSPPAEQPTEQLKNADETEKQIVQEDTNPVRVVEEPVSEISVDYESMSLSELKKIAKEKKVKGYTKIEIKEELIKLIKKAPPTLL